MINEYILKPQLVYALELKLDTIDELHSFTQNRLIYSDGQWMFDNVNEMCSFKNGDYVIKNSDGSFCLLTSKEFKNNYIEDRSIQ